MCGVADGDIVGAAIVDVVDAAGVTIADVVVAVVCTFSDESKFWFVRVVVGVVESSWFVESVV